MAQLNQAAIDFDAVRASARRNALDRYYAALFAPDQARADLIATAAFTGEIERVALDVGEAGLGEVRIAWWRDRLLGKDENGRSGSPVLDSFADVAERHAFSNEMLDAYFACHGRALYGYATADHEALISELRVLDGTPFALAGRILGIELDEEVLAAASRAAGFVRIGRDLPFLLMRGRLPLSEHAGAQWEQDWRAQIAWLARGAGEALQLVRRHLAGKPGEFATPLLSLALVEPHFRALQKAGHEPTRDLVDIAPLVRLWRIAKAHWTGRL